MKRFFPLTCTVLLAFAGCSATGQQSVLPENADMTDHADGTVIEPVPEAAPQLEKWNGPFGPDMPNSAALQRYIERKALKGAGGKVSTDVQVVHTAEPRHPPVALVTCRRGWVLVEFVVSPKGAVEQGAIVAQDHSELFGPSALEALKEWEFEPATRDGFPVARHARLPFVFNPAPGCLPEAPEINPVALDGELEIAVGAPEWLKTAEIVLMPTYGPISGGPFGVPVHQQDWVGGAVTFDTELLSQLTLLQLKHEPVCCNTNLRKEPPDARVVELKPYARQHGDSEWLYSSFFTESGFAHLVFTDRPVRLSGMDPFSVRLTYDVDLPAAGLYWVEGSIEGPDSVSYRRADETVVHGLVLDRREADD